MFQRGVKGIEEYTWSMVQRAEFDLHFGDQYHPTFEIRLPINTEEVAIILKDETDTVVWEYDVDLTDHSQSDVSSGARVQSE
ncbi:hypothetical protein ATANTOWER_013770, partial [Ataeniobius toweri]|nr:hypothetical protein [Ataeniobius toweri]